MKQLDLQYPDLSAGILAGGASRRMGFSKLQLALPDGTLLLQHKLNVLEPLVAEILLASAPDLSLPILISKKLKVVPDQSAHSGPLEGFCRIFQAAQTPYVFMTACDMPYFSWPVLDLLYQLAQEKKCAIVPVNDSGPVYLFSVFPVSILSALTELRTTTTALKSLEKKLDIHWLKPEQWKILDPEGRFYQNLNFPQEYAQFLKQSNP